MEIKKNEELLGNYQKIFYIKLKKLISTYLKYKFVQNNKIFYYIIKNNIFFFHWYQIEQILLIQVKINY